MVKLTRIYTRGGDRGETSLGGGRRVPKHDPRVAAFGTVDEANAAVGCARLHTKGEADAMLERIQNDLFDLGADLATPDGGKEGSLRIAETQVERLEEEIDARNKGLKPLDSFSDTIPASLQGFYVLKTHAVGRRFQSGLSLITAASVSEAFPPV